LSGVSDVRGDIYGLRATPYELLVLRPAFRAGDRSQLVQKILHDEPPPLRRVDPNLPRDLETIVHKAIAKQPSDRYSSAAALRDDLRLFLEDQPIVARPIGAAERLCRWCRRNPLLATLEAAVALLCLSAVVILTVSNVLIRHETAEKSKAIGEKDRALNLATSSEQRAKRRYYAT
jgi:serine/threonine protein kinase